MEDAIALSIVGQGKYEEQPKSRGYQPKSGGFHMRKLRERLEVDIGVYAQEACSIPAGMGKYIPEQTNCGVMGDIFIDISNKTVPGLILPEIVYNVIQKLGCIFKENHKL